MCVTRPSGLRWPSVVLAMGLAALGCGGATSASTVAPAEPIAVPTESESPRPSPTASSVDNYDALLARGESLVGEDQLDDAERVFDEAKSLRPADVRADYGKAVVAGRHCHLEQERCEECIERFRNLLAAGSYRHARYNRGSCHFTRGHHELALQDLNAAISENDQDPDYWLTRGLLHHELGHLANACADLEASERLGGGPTPQALVDACRPAPTIPEVAPGSSVVTP